MERASVNVTVRHGKDRIACAVDRKFNRQILARVVNAPDDNITVICRGKKLKDREPIAENSILLVITHDKSELQDFEEINSFVPLSMPSSSGTWLRTIRPYLPVRVYRLVTGVCGLFISLWLRVFGTAETGPAPARRGDIFYQARADQVVDLEVRLGSEDGPPTVANAQQADKITVDWEIDGCGALLLPARTEHAEGSVTRVEQSVRSNGRAGTVRCTVRDSRGEASQLFRFNEVD